MVQIYNRMLRITFEWLEFGFECFESLSNGSNLHSNASKWLEWLDFPFESLSNGFKYKFEPFESDLKHSNAKSNHSHQIRNIQMQIQTICMGVKPFESDSKHSIQIQIPIIRKVFEAFESKFDALNPFRIVIIWIRIQWL